MAINPIQLTQGAAREQIAAADVAALRASGVLIEDPRRERPRYFDGRFLAARDLIRDQQYFLTREADLGRAAGSGEEVVQPGRGAEQVTCSAGVNEEIAIGSRSDGLPHAGQSGGEQVDRKLKLTHQHASGRGDMKPGAGGSSRETKGHVGNQ